MLDKIKELMKTEEIAPRRNVNGYVLFKWTEDGRPLYKHPTKNRHFQDVEGERA